MGPGRDDCAGLAIVLPGQTLPVVFDADNPGIWMIQCHNVYRAESGMMTQIGYLR